MCMARTSIATAYVGELPKNAAQADSTPSDYGGYCAQLLVGGGSATATISLVTLGMMAAEAAGCTSLALDMATRARVTRFESPKLLLLLLLLVASSPRCGCFDWPATILLANTATMRMVA